MKAEVTKIETKKSHRGGYFKYVFFKSLDDGKSYRSCISDEFRNYRFWTNVKVGQILDRLLVNGKIVDADSQFLICNPAIPDEVRQQKQHDYDAYIEKKRSEISKGGVQCQNDSQTQQSGHKTSGSENLSKI